MRNGDRVGDAWVGVADPDHSGGSVAVAIHNAGPQPVLIGASVRRRLPLPGERVRSVSVPGRTLRGKLLASRYSAVYVIAAGEASMVTVPLPPSRRRRAELVVAIGEPDRLRLVRQAIKRPAAGRTAFRRRQHNRQGFGRSSRHQLSTRMDP